MKKLKVGLLCGGPSAERGISLNSARSVLDHLQAPDLEIYPIYFDLQKQAYEIEPSQLYSNTPADFDFKINHLGQCLSEEALQARLSLMDIVFPVIHGAFGEGGHLQAMLEKFDVPFIGSDAAACRQAFDKYAARQVLIEQGFPVLPALFVKQGQPQPQNLKQFFQRHRLDRAVVKPTRSGSSIGVQVVNTVTEAQQSIEAIFEATLDTQVIVEPFCQGTEFTLILLENKQQHPVALLPTEISFDIGEQHIFDYRKKYLPTRQVVYHTPPRFDDQIIQKIQRQGEQLFQQFGLRDLARFDGWLLEDGRIWFSDFNLISGLEQNSFLFLQAAQIGMSHADVLRYILTQACERYGLKVSTASRQGTVNYQKKPVNIIFGGETSERQVSLMSGTNVWLKLLRSETYLPHPYLLAPTGEVWKLPYTLTLRHTVEEVVDACRQTLESEVRLKTLRENILNRLRPDPSFVSQTEFYPKQMTLETFIKESSLVFIALHGGIGENGVLQARLEEAAVAFTGSSSSTSQLCMDKFATAERLADLAMAGIYTPSQRLIPTAALTEAEIDTIQLLWVDLEKTLGSPQIIVKPRGDGCSSGVVKLSSAPDLQCYTDLIRKGVSGIPPHTFADQAGIIEMPSSQPVDLLFEAFIETDVVQVDGQRLCWEEKTGWIEVTVAVLGHDGHMQALTPSLTVSSGAVLSLEEKFQGGTGINITPPPEKYVSAKAVRQAKKGIERVARELGISGFARIDAFLEIKTGHLIVIEANTIPGLTPSTVIYHQALAERPPLYPRQFLEKILCPR